LWFISRAFQHPAARHDARADYLIGYGSIVMPVDHRWFSSRDYSPGRPFVVRALWIVVEALVFLNPAVTSYRLKRQTLRAFGADIGTRVVIKPGVHVKHPWRLSVGDDSWIGERAWIDNLAFVSIGRSCCISQGAYLCTGNHDWSDPGMGLFAHGITLEDGAWVGAFARLAPGVVIGRDAILVMGAVMTENAAPRMVYAGNPASVRRERALRDLPGPSAGESKSAAASSV
jgi:putative colanic acid biosynthesis acetyltransferase WcaF